MWWRRPPPFDWETLNEVVTFVVRMDAKLDRIPSILGEDNEQEDAGPDA